MLPTKLSLDAIRVPGSAFYFAFSLAFVWYLFYQRFPAASLRAQVARLTLWGRFVLRSRLCGTFFINVSHTYGEQVL